MDLDLGFNCAFLLPFLSISKFETFFSLWIWSSIHHVHSLHGFFFFKLWIWLLFFFLSWVQFELLSCVVWLWLECLGRAKKNKLKNWYLWKLIWVWFFWFMFKFKSIWIFFLIGELTFLFDMSFIIIIIFSCHVSFKCANNAHHLPHKHIPLVVNCRD